MYGIFSGNRQIGEAPRKEDGVEEARAVISTPYRRDGVTARPPRSLVVRPINSRAKGKPVEVFARGHQRHEICERTLAA